MPDMAIIKCRGCGGSGKLHRGEISADHGACNGTGVLLAKRHDYSADILRMEIERSREDDGDE